MELKNEKTNSSANNSALSESLAEKFKRGKINDDTDSFDAFSNLDKYLGVVSDSGANQ